jgi:hypothetical protein
LPVGVGQVDGVGAEVDKVAGDDPTQDMTLVDAVAHSGFNDAVRQIEGAVVDHEGVFGDVVERRAVGLGRAVGHDVAATRVGDHVVLVKR